MNPMTMSHIVITALIALLFSLSHGQYTEPRLCDGLCYCSREEQVVDCGRQDKIMGVPTNLPPGTLKLMIQGGMFPEPGYLSAKNLTGLEHLVSLRIINSQLRAVESRTFFGMTNLRDLDLSLNLLYRIESRTFYGLNLQTLYLQQQRYQPDLYTLFGSPADPEPLDISTEAFYGLSATSIDLRKNFISNISYSLFSQVRGLEKLVLSDNKIRQLDSRFAEYFDNPNHLLDLTENPLDCSCKLAWLVNRAKDWGVQASTLTCISGPGSRVELKKLTTDHLCMGSKIQSIGVDISPAGNAATLSCTAVTFSRLESANQNLEGYRYNAAESYVNHPVVRQRPPPVAWKYVESGQLRKIAEMPSDHPPSFEQESTSTTLPLNVSLSQTGRKFSCITWDDKQNQQEILVTLRGCALPPLIEPKDSVKDSSTGSLEEGLSQQEGKLKEGASGPGSVGNMPYPQSGFLFQKQYTLLEMIGAVIGTFLVTLVVLLAGSRCMMMLKRRAISNHHAKEIGGRNTTYDAASKHSDAIGGMGTTISRAPVASNSNNGGFNSMACEGLGAAYPPYNHYLASSSGVTYPIHGPSAASRITSPTNGQLLPMSAATPLLSSNLTMAGLQGMQPIAQWPLPPGSAYSGSHEYDIPRGMELSQVASDQATIQREHQQQVQALSQQQQQAKLNLTVDAFGGDSAD
nr:slit 1 protein [Hymenolepis microstoma]